MQCASVQVLSPKNFHLKCVLKNNINHNLKFHYPIFAQQGYENTCKATSHIVYINCNFANMSMGIEVPQAILPNTIFEVVIQIP